ncbi:MAG TPA: ion transporter [Methanothrix soehngenii]|jgi:voltage-gated potassium channel|nr:ion transporter [Methanothrix soehngenii]
MNTSLKKRIFGILEPGDEDSKYFDPFIMALISLNVLAVVLETVDWLNAGYGWLFRAFDMFSVAIFTVEYILRAWSCTENPRFKAPFSGRLRYLITPMAIIDLLAILPFYLPFVIPDLRFIRALRLFRLFRILKLARYSDALKTFAEVLNLKKEELGVTLFATLIMLTVASSMVYEAENEVQPEAFANIPDAMWWGVVTLTTVGYGDIYPKTPLGKFIGSFVVIAGVGLFALPAGILASGFNEVLQRRKEKKRKRMICPHCHRYIGDYVKMKEEEDE